MSRAIICELVGDELVLSGTVRAACLECGADVAYEWTAPEGVSVPIRCGECGFELEMRRLSGALAAIRRPYGCRRFVDVDSSNLAAVGVRDGFLVVRFKSGGLYRYADAAGEFERLLLSKSKGEFFHREIRGQPADRICARYGCFEPANGTQVLCPGCRHPDRSVG